MEVEMDPQDADGFGDSPDYDRGADPSHDPCSEPGIRPNADSGLISGLEHVPRGSELRAELSGILSLASELESEIYLSYPRDPYASYRRHQLQSRLSSELNKLYRYKAKLDQEVIRCGANLDRIHTDAEKIHLEQTRECYDRAESLQRQQYHDALSDREAVSRAIARIQEVSRASPLRMFGGRDPFPPNMPVSPIPKYRDNPGGLTNELDRLLSFGPLGRKQR